MAITFALIGNQNCGKTTLFNQLTGSNQHVGNFPGVTVEKKEGYLRNHKEITIVDLPGMYSLSPYSPEEVVTRDYLIFSPPDVLINIVDATSLERNLYLTLQLMELDLPMVVALNMMDEVKASGGTIDIKLMSELLGVPIVPISASKNQGLDELMRVAMVVAGQKNRPATRDFCVGDVHRAVHSISYIIEEEAKAARVPVRFAAIKIVEGDEPMTRLLNLREMETDIIGHIIEDMEKRLHMDRDAALADMCYQYIEKICAQVVIKENETREQIRSVKIDSVLTNRVFALPLFFAIMLLIFWLTFRVIGAFFSDLLSYGINAFVSGADVVLTNMGINPTVHSLLIDGVFAGVGSVLSFLPIIVVLFLFLSLLEDSGYMARVAFVMDQILLKIGLSGRSFVPMLIGFGCSVPAIMATRTLPSQRDRKMTILLTPFMSCSAKLPIYALFTAVFFPQHKTLVMMALYLMGMIVAIVVAFLLKKTIFKGPTVPFVMELPVYRMPALKTVLLHMWQKAKDFLTKAFTIIFVATVLIWFLQSFDLHFNLVSDSSKSMLAAVGRLVAPIFAPLGFGDWRASTALITGLTAKEAVISTFAVLLGASNGLSLPQMMAHLFTPLTAFSFLTFTLLYMPCVAAMAATKRELGGSLAALGAMLFQTGVAWVVAFIIYQVGRIWFV